MINSLPDVVTAVATALASMLALIALVLGYTEYRRQGRARRAEFYIRMEDSFLKNADFQKIRSLLFEQTPTAMQQLRQIPKLQRNDYAGFFEDLAILAGNDLLSISVVNYMFGQDLLRCNRSSDFWFDFIKEDASWNVLETFVKKIEKLRNEPSPQKVD